MDIADTAIVLGLIPYNDHSQIVKLITQNNGIILGQVKRNSSSKNKTSGLFLPLNVLNLTFVSRKSKSFCYFKEISLHNASVVLPENEIYKYNIKLFLGEVLNNVIKDFECDSTLFNYIFNQLIQLNKSTRSVKNFHLCFLGGLIHLLGFSPSETYSVNTPFFNIETCHFETRPSVFYPLDSEISFLISHFFSPAANATDINITLNQRRQLLRVFIKILDFHLQGFNQIKSLSVLEEVFSL
jgi:DNA repair protein RecO (recombination protein O)